MILGGLDLSNHPHPKPVAGQMVGTVLVEGNTTITYARGSIKRSQSVSFYARAWQGLGGAAANTQASLQYLCKQGEELAGNGAMNPVFVQWTASADPSAVSNVADSHDGWYVIESFAPDYERFMVGGQGVEVRMILSYVAPGPPSSLAMAYSGGALSSNYSGAAQIAVGYPLGAANQAATAVSRTGGEGALPLSVAPSASLNPLPFTPGTLAQLYQGGVRVYDTLTVGGNTVPTNGTFVHASWVQVYGTDHIFTGDVILTNGLHLYRFQTGTAMICTAYLWSTAQVTPGWAQFAQPGYNDNAGNAGTLRSYTLDRVGLEESRVTARLTTSAGNFATIAMRLQRAQSFSRVDFTPTAQAVASNLALQLVTPGTQKISYNSGKAADSTLSTEAQLAVQTDYGYGAAFVNSTTYPWIYGWLYQNEPAGFQPRGDVATVLYLGDNSGPAQNSTRSYGIFAVPFGTTTTTTDKLQAEAESGTLGTGWTSQAGAGGNSNALEAKCASGTVATNADTFGTAFIPPAGTYDIWFRMKVTTNVGSNLEMTVGLWDNIAAAYVAGGSTTFNRTAMTTAYVWYRAGAGVTPTAGNAMRFRAVTALTLGTDWFIDEAVMVPLTLSGANTGPQDIWQQFRHDRSVKMMRL